MKIKPYIIWSILTLLSPNLVFGSEADSLQSLLPVTKDTQRVDVLNRLVWAYRNSAPQQSLAYSEEALQLSDSLGYEQGKLMSLSFSGVAYRNLGNYFRAMQQYWLAQVLADSLGNKEQAGFAHINMGNLYIYQGKIDEAEEVLKMAEDIAIRTANDKLLAYSYLNLGRVMTDKGRFWQALDYLEKSLALRVQENDEERIAVCLKYIGDVHVKRKDYEQGLKYYKESLAYKHILEQDMDLKADILHKMGIALLGLGHHEEACLKGEASLALALQVGAKLRAQKAHELISAGCLEFGLIEQAFAHFKLAAAYQDSISSEEITRKITELEMKHDFEEQKRVREIKHRAELRQERLLRNFILLVTLVVLILLFVLIRYYRLKSIDNKKLAKQRDEILAKNNLLEQQKEEISTQRDQLKSQRDVLSVQKQQITDSIQYASRIQNAVLPPKQLVGEVVPDHFILYKPRDIVSGDFYWAAKIENKQVVAVADCTGHGVPGAFMSMLGISMLNEIVLHHHILEPDQVLEKLRYNIKNALRQTGKDNEAKDGMDISVCVIDLDDLILKFSGANNPVYLINAEGLKKINATRNPIGIYHREKAFELETMQLQRGDLLYLFSDGFVDQFGGESGEKFKQKRFKQLIKENSLRSMQEQREVFERTLADWMKPNHDQIDDILVVGIKVG